MLGCLDALGPSSKALLGAKQYYGGGREKDPYFELKDLQRLQGRAQALGRGEACSEMGIGEPELRRAKLALQTMGVSLAQFVGLFLYSDEISSPESEKEEKKEAQGGCPTPPSPPQPAADPKPSCLAECQAAPEAQPSSKPKPDQLYTLLTSAQRAAFEADPNHPAHAVLKALAPLVGAIQEYLQAGTVPKVDPEQDVLYRGVGYEVSAEQTALRRLPWQCFSSASLSASSARSFLRPGGTLFVTRSAGAVPMFFLSAYMEELECLVPPTEFILRDALPISILRMMGVQGSVMLLEDPKV